MQNFTVVEKDGRNWDCLNSSKLKIIQRKLNRKKNVNLAGQEAGLLADLEVDHPGDLEVGHAHLHVGDGEAEQNPGY